MITTTYRFEEIKVKATHKWVDADGKNRQETKTFSQTINPFNKNKDGSQKTRSDILGELNEDRKIWLREMRLKDSGLFGTKDKK